MRLLHFVVGAEILPKPETDPESAMCYLLTPSSFVQLSFCWKGWEQACDMKVSESVPGSAPIAPIPLAVASILHKGKIHPGAQEHILSGAPLGTAVQTTAPHCSSGYCGLKYLIWWGRE